MFVYSVHANNVNHALATGIRILSGGIAEREDSRNGPVRVASGPVMTIYKEPMKRVLFSPKRDANPFFHLFEAMWMLSGSQDLPWVAQFNKRFTAYSDDGGQTQPGAYGYRWRNYFGYDQLEAVVQELGRDPKSRRAVLAMWDGGSGPGTGAIEGDLNRALGGSNDIPCNTHCYFRIKGGKLEMMVNCRSNDIVWGAYGANAVHFSVLQEYLAARLGVGIGVMYQNSFNFHYYENVVGNARELADNVEDNDHYQLHGMSATPMFGNGDLFMRELPTFMEFAEPDGVAGSAAPRMNDPFLSTVAAPMLSAWRYHKDRDYERAEEAVRFVRGPDWRMAAGEWIARRARAHKEKQGG